MSQIPQRLRAVVAVSAVGAGLLVIPATATADDSPSGGAASGGGGADASAGGGASAGSGSTTTGGATEPGNVVGAAGVAVMTAGSQVLDSFSKAAQSVLAPKVAAPKPVVPGTVVPEAVASAPAATPPVVEQPAVADPVVEVAPSFARASAPEAAAAAAVAPAPAPAPTPTNPIADFFARMMGNTTTNTNHCGCGWIPDDDDDTPPPDNPPPDNPPPDQYGWGLPIGVPSVGIPGVRKYRYVACAAGLALPPVPFRTVVVPPLPPLPPPLPPGGGGGGGGGGAAPLTLLGGGLPVGGGPGPEFTAIPASYTTGLTFETGLDDKLPAPNGLAALGALSSILLAAGGGLLFWRRNAQRQTDVGRTVPVCRVPAGGLWE